MSPNGCLICAKHADEASTPGGFLYADELVVASHVFDLDHTRRDHFLGHLVVETRRHAPSITDLTAAEGAAVGTVAVALARALRGARDVEWVYTATIGHHVAHFHLHVFPRYRGTPEGVPWHSPDEWEGAPKGGDAEIARTAASIRARLRF